MSNVPVITNIDEILSSAQKDATVGIKVAWLSGDETFSLFCAEIEPGRNVKAHYHSCGIEIYLILEGEGLILLGKPLSNDTVSWEEPLSLKQGDSFTIQPGTVHQLFNRSTKPLKALFVCPKSHLGADRFVVNSFESRG